MTYLQREQYSQLRLFTCCEESEALSPSPLRSNKNTQTGEGRGVGRGEGTRVRVWRSIYFQAACVPRQECVRYDFRSFSSFFDRVRWLESTSRAIRHGLAGLSSCSIRSSSMFSSSSSSASFVLHCWQLYTSYRTTILGCSYFRCGQTLRSLASEPNRFISDLSLGLRNNSRKSIPTNES